MALASLYENQDETQGLKGLYEEMQMQLSSEPSPGVILGQSMLDCKLVQR